MAYVDCTTYLVSLFHGIVFKLKGYRSDIVSQAIAPEFCKSDKHVRYNLETEQKYVCGKLLKSKQMAPS